MPHAEVQRSQICEMWRGRLKGVQRNVEVWQALLSVRTLVLPMHEDTHTWLKFASLCRKSGRIRSVLLCSYQNNRSSPPPGLVVHAMHDDTHTGLKFPSAANPAGSGPHSDCLAPDGTTITGSYWHCKFNRCPHPAQVCLSAASPAGSGQCCFAPPRSQSEAVFGTGNA